MRVFLAGPIDYWWNENWETPSHIAYMEWRERVKTWLVEAGHVVYLPHQAIKGAWDESMQVINDTALSVCDVFVYLTPHDVPAHGTEAERKQAEGLGKRVEWCPPGAGRAILDLTQRLDDPYGDVQRKSYSCSHTQFTKVKRMVGRKVYNTTICLGCKKTLDSTLATS